MNAVAPVEVKVLGLQGRVTASARIIGDSIRHKIVFDGKSLIKVAPDRKAQLRFTVTPGGRLYSFTVR